MSARLLYTLETQFCNVFYVCGKCMNMSFVRDMYLCNQPINLSEVTKSGKVHLQHHKLHLLEMSTFEQFQGKN